LRTCGVIFDEFFESENVESGCGVELGGGEFDLGSSQISLQLSNSSYPVSIFLSTSSPSSILVSDGVDISIEENVIFSLSDVELSGVISSSSVFSVGSGGYLNFSSCNLSDFVMGEVSLVEVDGGSLISSNGLISNISLGSSPFFSSSDSSVSLMDVEIEDISGNGSLVRLDGFSSSSFDSISLLHFSSLSSSLIRVEDEAGVTISDSSFEDCVLTSGSGCILSSMNGWMRFEDVSFSSCSAVDTFYIDGDGDLAVLDSRFDDENSNVSLSQPESFISHSTGEMIVSSTIFNSSNSLFKSISSSSSSSSLIRNLEFEDVVVGVDVPNQVECETFQFKWGDEVSSNHSSETFQVCDATASCEDDEDEGMTCVCVSPTTGDPTTGSCVSPDGTLTIVPNPIILGSFQKPYSGNGSVFLINIGGTPVDYQIYGVEEYCDVANSTNSSSSLYSFPNLTNYDDLCSDVNESGDFDVSWDGINGTVVLCSFNTLNVSVSSDGLSKGDYEAHLVVDSDSESGAEGMTISFSVSVTSSLIHSSFEVFYNGSETDSSWLEGGYGKVNESSGSNFKVRNDEEVLVLVEPRDLDDLPILSADDLIEVDVNGSSCVESSSHPLLDDYHRLFECSFSHLDVGLRYLDVSIEDHSIGLRVVNVSCKDD